MSRSLIQLREETGSFVYVELADGEHHLAHGAAVGVAVDVDVGEVVVGADLLDLAEGVLQGVPVPQANVLQGGLVAAGSAAATVVSAGNSCCEKRSSP